MSARPIGVLGGTYDPPHLGHLAAAEEARVRLGLDGVLWVPSGTPPHKRHSGVTSPHHRVAMLRLAVADNAAFSVSEVELAREGPSYTVDTLTELGRRYGTERLVFLMGSDEFTALPRWREPERVAQLASIAVMVRAGVAFDPTETEAMLPILRDRYTLVPAPNLPLSSEELRRRVRSGLPLRYLVPEGVREYIERNRLYTSDEQGVYSGGPRG